MGRRAGLLASTVTVACALGALCAPPADAYALDEEEQRAQAALARVGGVSDSAAEQGLVVRDELRRLDGTRRSVTRLDLFHATSWSRDPADPRSPSVVRDHVGSWTTVPAADRPALRLLGRPDARFAAAPDPQVSVIGDPTSTLLPSGSVAWALQGVARLSLTTSPLAGGGTRYRLTSDTQRVLTLDVDAAGRIRAAVRETAGESERLGYSYEPVTVLPPPAARTVPADRLESAATEVRLPRSLRGLARGLRHAAVVTARRDGRRRITAADLRAVLGRFDGREVRGGVPVRVTSRQGGAYVVLAAAGPVTHRRVTYRVLLWRGRVYVRP